jgi:PAS domain S-box-containing protein
MKDGETEKYKIFFDRLPEMLCIAGFDGYFLELNPEWEKVLGLATGELLKRPYLDMIHPEDRGEAGQAVQRVLSGEPCVQLETRCLCGDGSYKWLSWRCAPDPDKACFYVTAADITARKMTGAAIRESEATLRRILDLAPMSMSIVNIDGTIEYINKKAEQTFGFRHDEIPTMDRWWEQAYPEEKYRKETVDRWMGRVRRAFADKTEIDGGEYTVTCKDGTVKNVFIFGVIAADKVFCMFDDITLRVRAEQALRKSETEVRSLNAELEQRVRERTAELTAANQELMEEISQRREAERARQKLHEELIQSQKMEALGRLAGGIAHDFNNILVSISGYAEFLMNTLPPGAPARDDLAEIQLETERGSALTRQLLTLSRKQETQAQLVDINKAAGEAEKMLRRIIGANMHLERKLAPAPGLISADPSQISQVIMNLVINARDAMPDGGRIVLETGSASVGGDTSGMRLAPKPGDYVTLSVSDTGTGMSAETMSHVFEPFFTTKAPGSGTGLGLSTVYGIVNQAGGGISLESAEGAGTTFKIYFPLAVKPPEPHIK